MSILDITERDYNITKDNLKGIGFKERARGNWFKVQTCFMNNHPYTLGVYYFDDDTNQLRFDMTEGIRSGAKSLFYFAERFVNNFSGKYNLGGLTFNEIITRWHMNHQSCQDIMDIETYMNMVDGYYANLFGFNNPYL